MKNVINNIYDFINDRNQTFEDLLAEAESGYYEDDEPQELNQDAELEELFG